MENKLLIETRMSYGRILYYPACRVSRILAELSGKKTLSAEELRKLSEVGFEVRYKSEQDKQAPPKAEGESK